MDDGFKHDDQFVQNSAFYDFRNCDDVDGDLGTIKMKILVFQGKNNLGAYLEWEKKIDLIFHHNHYFKGKKVKFAMIEFMIMSLYGKINLCWTRGEIMRGILRLRKRRRPLWEEGLSLVIITRIYIKKIIGFDTMDKEFWWIPYGDGYCDD